MTIRKIKIHESINSIQLRASALNEDSNSIFTMIIALLILMRADAKFEPMAFAFVTVP